MYEENNVKEWSRVLSAKYGSYFRPYKEDNETLERWANRLSFLYGYRFKVYEDTETTLEQWSKVIGG